MALAGVQDESLSVPPGCSTPGGEGRVAGATGNVQHPVPSADVDFLAESSSTMTCSTRLPGSKMDESSPLSRHGTRQPATDVS